MEIVVEDYCELCSRPGWTVGHDIDDDHSLSNQFVPDPQIKAAQKRYPNVKRSELWTIMSRHEVNAA